MQFTHLDEIFATQRQKLRDTTLEVLKAIDMSKWIIPSEVHERCLKLDIKLDESDTSLAPVPIKKPPPIHPLDPFEKKFGVFNPQLVHASSIFCCKPRRRGSSADWK
jgi:hypothetical protein